MKFLKSSLLLLASASAGSSYFTAITLLAWTGVVSSLPINNSRDFHELAANSDDLQDTSIITDSTISTTVLPPSNEEKDSKGLGKRLMVNPDVTMRVPAVGKKSTTSFRNVDIVILNERKNYVDIYYRNRGDEEVAIVVENLNSFWVESRWIVAPKNKPGRTESFEAKPGDRLGFQVDLE